MNKIRISILVFVVALISAGSACAGGGYCALAYSKSTTNWGEGHGFNTRAQAERRALRECRAPDAFVAGWGHNRYVVLAVGSGGAWGCGSEPTLRAASAEALRLCPAADAHILRYVYSFD
jgi:hypothetical protein